MAPTYLQSERMKAIKYWGPEGKKSIQANPLPLYSETFFSIPPRTALSWSLEGGFDHLPDPLDKEVPKHSQEKLTQTLILCLLKTRLFSLRLEGVTGCT